ncbi:MSMEG_0565 family glycosyltransferase [Pelomonas sp. P8]|uniref:MSMEG_0565 family glycosyltransferase n=2 Tax=Pelomonas cellulosilytica TaxID=2906762 RepID=A0ABS8XUC4_9BURK|nr:MSMEG_0565 family glycosyltransferase [Pelomonas sp. P8]
MRIALLTHSVRPRGGVVHTLELAHQLAREGHAVTVVASVEQNERLFRPVDVPVELVPLPVLTGGLVEQVRQRIEALVQALPAVLARGSYDLIHAQDSLSGNALARLRAAGQRMPPWLRTVHHLDRFDEPVLNDWQDRAWRAADGMACVSDSWCAHFRDELGVAAERMFNGVDLARFCKQPASSDAAAVQALGLPSDSGPVCLLVGGVEARKNTVRLLHAFARLRDDDPDWSNARLVIAGGASMLDHSAARFAWQASLAELGLVEGPGRPVVRTGPLPDAALPALMRRATLLAMPSLVEGFGLAALEALACGTPVLVSQRRPFTEHLAGVPGVAWCDPEAIDSIATGLRHAATRPKLSEPPAVCTEHSWARSAALHADWYRRTLATHAEPAEAAFT